MSQTTIKSISKYVIKSLNTNIPRDQIRESLVKMGINKEDCEIVINSIIEGFKSGTMDIVTSGQSSHEIEKGENEFFDESFKLGRAAMRFTSPIWVLIRLVSTYIIIPGALIFLVWKFILS